ncbi:MAG: serine/threonine-protein kinase [Planctomycetota bacterium]
MSAPEDSPSAEALRREAIDALIAEALDAHEAGGTAALDAFRAGLTEHRDEVLARLALLDRVGLLGGGAESRARAGSGAGTRPEAGPLSALPERFGDFEVLECLGGGGMGVVHRARQISIGREVAIKFIRPEQVHFPGVRQRFQREVEIIAKLEHEGIVRLYSYGEDRGLPWFAMERIDGLSLADIFAQLQGRAPRDVTGADIARCFPEAPASGAAVDLFNGPWRDVAVRIVQRAAEALEEAHRQGVLHRDLKPSNIMLTARGRVVLLDFGLAWSRGTDRLTRSGAQIGTFHYMAPEQLRGDATALDTRTDVYALGVLLRELLTLRPVFAGETIDVIARAVQEGRPAPIDRRRAALTWEAETICLVAMDLDAARRFPSAAALARDLENLLERRTIQAVRPALALRMRRFAQRHKALSAAVGVLSLALLLTPSVVAWRERELRQRIERVNSALADEITRADSNLSLAADALNRTLRRLNAEDIIQVPDLRDFSDGLVVDTADFLDVLSKSNPDEPAARLRLAETLLEAGHVRWQLWDLARTEPIFQRIVDLLAGETSGDHADELRLEAQLALVFLGLRSPERRIEAYLSALELVRSHGDVSGRSKPLRVQYARALERLGTSYGQVRDARATELLGEAQAMRERLLQEDPSSDDWLDYAAGADALRQAFERAGDSAAAAEQTSTSQRAIDNALALGAADATALERLGEALSVHAFRLRNRGDIEGAERMQRITSERWMQLIKARPSRLEALRSWALSENRRVGDLDRLGRPNEATQLLREVAARLEHVVAVWPSETQVIARLIEARVSLCRRLMTPTRQRQEIQHELDLAARDAALLLQQGETLASSLDSGARLFAYRARIALLDDDLDGAERELARCAELRAAAERRAPSDRVSLNEELDRSFAAAEIALRRDQPAQAAAALARLKALPADLLEQVPTLRAWLGDPLVAREVARAGVAR